MECKNVDDMANIGKFSNNIVKLLTKKLFSSLKQFKAKN